MTTHPHLRGSYLKPPPADCRKEGYLAGASGKSAFDNPHPRNTFAAREWLLGWSTYKRDERGDK